MTEKEWFACADARTMLATIGDQGSRRKLGLWVVACYRAVIKPGKPFVDAVDALEHYVEGEAGEAELDAIHRKYHTSLVLIRPPTDPCTFASLQLNMVGRHLKELPATLLRDMIGPIPFRSVQIDPAWLACSDNLVQRMAEEIYERWAIDRLLQLAKALEEAGCDNDDILSHLRSVGPHVRGCWVIDLILGKS